MRITIIGLFRFNIKKRFFKWYTAIHIIYAEIVYIMYGRDPAKKIIYITHRKGNKLWLNFSILIILSDRNMWLNSFVQLHISVLNKFTRKALIYHVVKFEHLLICIHRYITRLHTHTHIYIYTHIYLLCIYALLQP